MNVNFIPFKLGLKEKILAIRYFKSIGRNDMLKILSSSGKTDEEKISVIREQVKDKMESDIWNGLEKLKKHGEVAEFVMIPDSTKIIFTMMTESEAKLETWEKDWKNKTRIISPGGLALRCIGIKVETNREVVKDA